MSAADFRKTALAACMALFACQVQAADAWTGFRDVQQVQAIETGGFLVTFSTPLASPCAAAGPSTVYFYHGQNTLTASGVKTHYAAALAALTTGRQINVMYDNASSHCWARYIVIQK